MSRILLADDSPHAQRMGERILREEGYEVVSVTDGETALKRMGDVDPDLIIADVFLPGKNGFELCRYVKSQPAHRHVRVVMTAGMLEAFDEDEAVRAGADSIIKKPFEASVVIEIIKPLIAEAHLARGSQASPATTIDVAPAPVAAPPPPPPAVEAPVVTTVPAPKAAAVPPQPVPPAAAAKLASLPPELDPELVRAAITVALDAAMPSLIDEITERVISTMRNNH